MTKSPFSRSFEQALLEAINEALSALGEDVKMSIFFHLDQVFHTKEQGNPQRIGDFSSSLEQIFGSDFRPLAMLVTKSIPDKIRGTCEWAAPIWIMPDLAFQEYVHTIRSDFEGSSMDRNEIEVLMNADDEEQEHYA